MNLMEALSKNFPGVQAHCIGDPMIYANIVWEQGPDLPSEADLVQCLVMDQKAAKVQELSSASRLAIIRGFESSAIGSPHHYDGEEVDQLNLIGSYSSSEPTEQYPNGVDMYYAVREMDGNVQGPKQYKIHTHAQLKIVIIDGAQFKLGMLMRFNAMRDYVNNTTLTPEQLNAINWDMTFPIPE